jgi:hypothetical protein
MPQCKYIVTDLGFSEPIVFGETLNHSDVARAIGGTVLGAGFCYIQDNKYVCYGKSTSLKMDSRGDEDSKVLNRRFGITY